MDVAVEQPRRFKVKRAAFFVVVALFVALCFLMSPIMFLVLGWFMEIEPGEVSHAVHEISFGALFALAVVGLLTQLRRPAEKVALGYQVAISIGVLLVLAVVVDRMFDPVIGAFGLAIVLMLALHPAGRRLIAPETDPSPLMLGAAALLVVPFAIFTVAEMRLAVEAAELFQPIAASIPADADEAAFTAAIAEAGLTPTQRAAVEHSFHWTAMAAYAITCVLLAFVAALRPSGWRVVAWSVAAAVGIYAAASLVFPSDASAAAPLWAALALFWALGFIVLSRREGRFRGRAEESADQPARPAA